MEYDSRWENPSFERILFFTECSIFTENNSAKQQGVSLTDSDIQTLLQKAITQLEKYGFKKNSQNNPQKQRHFLNKKDRILHKVQQLFLPTKHSAEYVQDDKSYHFTPGDWIALYQVIQKSCAIHTGNTPDSRGYLDFLTNYIHDVTEIDAKSHYSVIKWIAPRSVQDRFLQPCEHARFHAKWS